MKPRVTRAVEPGRKRESMRQLSRYNNVMQNVRAPIYLGLSAALCGIHATTYCLVRIEVHERVLPVWKILFPCCNVLATISMAASPVDVLTAGNGKSTGSRFTNHRQSSHDFVYLSSLAVCRARSRSSLLEKLRPMFSSVNCDAESKLLQKFLGPI